MKIFHINCNYMSTALHQIMIRHLNNHVKKNTVFAPVSDKTVIVITPDDNVTVSNCFKKSDRFFFYFKQYKILKSLLKRHNIYDYDCIHAYTLFTDGNCAYRLSKIYKKPFIVAVRDTDVNLFFRKCFWLRYKGNKILQNASKIIFLSESYKENVICNYVPKKYREKIKNKSVIIPNGVDDFWFDNIVNYNPKKAQVINNLKSINLIYVGVINKRKNVLTGVKAANILRERGWKISFNIVGKIVDFEEFNLISKYDFVKYHEAVDKEELIEFYRHSDVFVMPSLTETFGLTYVEALTQNLPVIYSKDQGFDRHFEEGYIGYSVNSTSEIDIADKIECICKEYDIISKNCKNAIYKFKWDDICKEYYQLYLSIIGEG